MANPFDDVDLSIDKTMKRMVKTRQKEDNTLIDKCADLADHYSYEAAVAIRRLKTEE